MPTLDVETSQGLARVHLHETGDAGPALLLGHGAGGSVGAPDLQTTTRIALDRGFTVALVEQPYRVAGRRSVPPPARLDEAWIAVVDHLRREILGGVPLVAGGRSSGARVACRTAAATGAAAVLCLAFPLLAPRRSGPPASRAEELDGVEVPVLVVQGARDRFGMPSPAPGRTVAEVPGDHGLRAGQDAIAEAVASWLAVLRLQPAATSRRRPPPRTSTSRSPRTA